MEETIVKIAENLIEIRKLKEELCDKEYWIQKAAQETDFIPTEGDWIHVEITLFKIEVSVCHKNYGGSKYWKNGYWFDDPFDSNYPLPEKMLANYNICQISREESEVPPEKWSKEDHLSIHYCDLADSQL